MAKFTTRSFWVDTAERSVSTAAQTALVGLGYEMVETEGGQMALNVSTVDWLTVLYFALGGLVLTVLKSLAFGLKDGSPSAVSARHPDQHVDDSDSGRGPRDHIM